MYIKLILFVWWGGAVVGGLSSPIILPTLQNSFNQRFRLYFTAQRRQKTEKLPNVAKT